MCFLDAVYKTTGLEVPLYFLVVKTNVSYACIASFIVQYEDEASITEALKIIRTELDKHEINLKSFMVDTSEVEIEAVRKVFPGKSSEVRLTQIRMFCKALF